MNPQERRSGSTQNTYLLVESSAAPVIAYQRIASALELLEPYLQAVSNFTLSFSLNEGFH